MKKKTLLIGRGTIAVNCLHILKKNQELPNVIICDPDDTGKDTWTLSLLKYAHALGYRKNKNLYITRKINTPEFISLFQKKHPNIDIIFSIQPKSLFKQPFISLARDYVVNLHFSPLPKLRGVATSPWAILDGLDKMGVSLHIIDSEGIDDGPIIAQKKFIIKKSDTSRMIYDKCVTHGTKLFEKKFNSILLKKIKPKKQNEKEATYHPMGELDYKNLEVDLSKNENEVIDFIRSRIFPPFQYPYITHDGNKIYIQHFSLTATATSQKGKILKRKGRQYTIAMPKQSIIIEKYKLEKYE